MKGDSKESDKNTIRMELKYCERCGSLWLRECGAGVVYCSSCQAEVAELPAPKKKPERVKVPVRRHTVVEDYGFAGADEDEMDLEAAGGAA
jgi:uncharacterized Zn finger protein (UPF0148 family)